VEKKSEVLKSISTGESLKKKMRNLA